MTDTQIDTEQFSFEFEELLAKAWTPYENWDNDPLSRQQFAHHIQELANRTPPQHELRAAMLYRFSRGLLDRIGCANLSLDISPKAQAIDFRIQRDSAGLVTGQSYQVPYVASLSGDTAIQQLNVWVGILVRGAGEYWANLPHSAVGTFLEQIREDFKQHSGNKPLQTQLVKTAPSTVLERVISAELASKYPGFARMALDGLYAMQSTGLQMAVTETQANHQKQLHDEKTLPISTINFGHSEKGERQTAQSLELQLAAQYYHAETTTPGTVTLDPEQYKWADSIQHAGLLLRNVQDLTEPQDLEHAKRATEVYASVISSILEQTDPPQPDKDCDQQGNGDGGSKGNNGSQNKPSLPDMSKLQKHFSRQESAQRASQASDAPKQATDYTMKGSAPTDEQIPFDEKLYQNMLDSEQEEMNEHTPWAEGSPKVTYTYGKAKAASVAKSRYTAIRSVYAPEIRKLRRLVKDAYEIRTETHRALRTGKPDAVRLTGVRFGNQNVFKRTQTSTDGEPISVIVLVDESGSMSARTDTTGYKDIPAFSPQDPHRDMSYLSVLLGTGADGNPRADFENGTRADIARVFSVMVTDALSKLPGIRVFTYGYSTYSHEYSHKCIVRELASPDKPYGAALSCAYGANSDKEALIQALKQLAQEDQNSRQAIIYLADGGITDPKLEELLKQVQRRMPIMFIDMSNDLRGTGGSLKIKHHHPVDSIPQAVSAAGKFFKEIVLG